MELQVIGTGSAGNCYILQQGDNSLLLEAGLRWQDILSALPNGIRDICACLLTHEHKDHSRSVLQVMKYGIQTVMSRGTWDEITKDEKLTPIQKPLFAVQGEPMMISPFTILPVQAMHDAKEPLAFLIRHDGTGETVLFATDTYLLPNRYPGINHWIVECNYTTAKAEELLSSPEKAPLYERLMRSHLSLERLATALKANDLSHTRTIVLVHISNERGDSPYMEETIRQETGIRTIAAVNGMTIKLGDCPF